MAKDDHTDGKKPYSIEELIIQDDLEEALKRYQDFLERCHQDFEELPAIAGRLRFLNDESNRGTLDDAFKQRERNKIRVSVQNTLNQFKREALKNNFEIQSRSEVLSGITHRDQVVHEILDYRLLPKRYRRDPPQNDTIHSSDPSKIKEGNSSIIYRLKNVDTERHAIALVMKTPELDENIQEEIRRLIDLRHRNVVKVIDAEIGAFPYFVITEYVYGETLPKALEATGPRHPAQASDWLYQLTDALDYLRHKRILHTNVRPSKIHIDDEWQVMISPFDLLHVYPYKKQPHMPVERTFNRYRDLCQYGSPELLKTDGEGLEFYEMCISDLYSIGLIGYKILTGEDLFEGKLVYDILENRRRFVDPKSDYRSHRFKLLPKCRLSDIIKKLIVEDADKRSRNYNDLHSLVRALHPLTRQEFYQDSALRQSYRRCLAGNKEFIDDFYRHYHSKDGARKQEFSEIGSRRQSVMLQLSIDILLDLDNKKEYLQKLVDPAASRHGKYSVEDFGVFLDAFIETVRKNDRLWDDHLAQQWQDLRNRTLALIGEARNDA